MKLPPIADGNKCRDPQPDIMRSMADLGIIGFTWDVQSNPFPEGNELITERRQKDYRNQKGWRTPRKQDPLNQQDQFTYELTKYEAACTVHGSIPDGVLKRKGEMNTACPRP